MGKTYKVVMIDLEGKKYTIDIGESENDFKRTTVLTLKKKLIEQLKIEVGNTDDLRMIFGGEQLEDKKTLADYGIKDRTTILAVRRLCGGGLSPVKNSCGNEDSRQ